MQVYSYGLYRHGLYSYGLYSNGPGRGQGAWQIQNRDGQGVDRRPEALGPRLYSYGLYSYGLHSHGLYRYGLCSYGLYSYGLCSYGRASDADMDPGLLLQKRWGLGYIEPTAEELVQMRTAPERSAEELLQVTSTYDERKKMKCPVGQVYRRGPCSCGPYSYGPT